MLWIQLYCRRHENFAWRWVAPRTVLCLLGVLSAAYAHAESDRYNLCVQVLIDIDRRERDAQ